MHNPDPQHVAPAPVCAMHPAQQQLAAWRAAGHAQRDPVGFHLLDALTRRAPAHTGIVREHLEQRIATLMQTYAQTLALDAPLIAPLAAAQDATDAAQSDTLATLTQRLDTGHAVPWRSHYPTLPLLDTVRQDWIARSATRQLRQSAQQVHDNAGPLNSNQVMHRALTLMRQISPGYLHQLLAYLDALAWMEQFNTAVTASKAADQSRRAKNTKKTAPSSSVRRSKTDSTGS